MKFGERVKAIRLQKGMTQEDLARLLGISKQSVSRYENAEREPNIRTAKKLANVFGVSLEELVEASSIDEDGDTNVMHQFHDVVNKMNREELFEALAIITEKLKEK